MTIKHLVIPGGGPTGIKAIGALQYLEQHGYWNINDIETIYATSAGAIITVLLCLKFDWETINDYIVKRPWNDAFQVSVNQIFEAYSKKGIFDKNVAEIFYKPFFKAKDIPMEITMKEFYELSKIEIHLFSLDINTFNLEDISYITHPDLQLLTAVQMSSAIPVLISPVCINNRCYVDGGVICNYPVNQCILRAENIDEIFGLRNKYSKKDENIVKNESTILEYVMNFISRLINNVASKFEEKEKEIPNELIYDTDLMTLANIQLTLSSKEERQRLIDFGIEAGKTYFLEKRLVPEQLVEKVDAIVLDNSVQELG
jgi:predicted acylesterase/phospholipase RssA